MSQPHFSSFLPLLSFLPFSPLSSFPSLPSFYTITGILNHISFFPSFPPSFPHFPPFLPSPPDLLPFPHFYWNSESHFLHSFSLSFPYCPLFLLSFTSFLSSRPPTFSTPSLESSITFPSEVLEATSDLLSFSFPPPRGEAASGVYTRPIRAAVPLPEP